MGPGQPGHCPREVKTLDSCHMPQATLLVYGMTGGSCREGVGWGSGQSLGLSQGLAMTEQA